MPPSTAARMAAATPLNIYRVKTIIDAGDHVSPLHQLSERHAAFRTGSPRSAVHPDDQRRPRFSERNMKIEFQRVRPDPRIFNLAHDVPAIRIRGSAQGGTEQKTREPTEENPVHKMEQAKTNWGSAGLGALNRNTDVAPSRETQPRRKQRLLAIMQNAQNFLLVPAPSDTYFCVTLCKGKFVPACFLLA